MEELEAKVDSKAYDIVAVSETWFEESNWRTGLEGYKVYRCDRKERIGGGGVTIWVKDSIVSRESGDIKEGNNVKNSVWVEIRDCNNSKILGGCFYRALGGKEEEERFHGEFKRACGKGRVLIMRDFNLPGIDWVQEQGKGRADEDSLVLVQDCF